MLWMCIYAYRLRHIFSLYLCKQIQVLLAPILISAKQIYSTMPHMQGQVCLLNNLNISYNNNQSYRKLLSYPLVQQNLSFPLDVSKKK